jgi:hypothetical protein
MSIFVLSVRAVLSVVMVGTLAGCASVNLGFSLPIGRSAGVGVSVGSDGRIGTSVGVGVGGGSVSVGTSGRLPPPSGATSEKKTESN